MEENTEVIRLTDSALAQVQKHLALRGKGIGLRLGVRTSGCSGMAYKIEFVDQLAQNDRFFEVNGIKIVIDEMSLPWLSGIRLDYTKEGLSEGFRFENPNEKSRCGCGQSFTV